MKRSQNIDRINGYIYYYKRHRNIICKFHLEKIYWTLKTDTFSVQSGFSSHLLKKTFQNMFQPIAFE